MASNKAALVLSLNILFFTMVSSTYVPSCSCSCSPPSTPKVPKYPPTPKTPSPTPKVPKYPPSPKTPSPKPPSPKYGSCPVDTIKFGVCADLLGLVHVGLGKPAKSPCCSLIQGLADLEAAVCLCTALRANVLGINLDVPIKLTLLLNYCGKEVPKGFVCA